MPVFGIVRGGGPTQVNPAVVQAIPVDMIPDGVFGGWGFDPGSDQDFLMEIQANVIALYFRRPGRIMFWRPFAAQVQSPAPAAGPLVIFEIQQAVVPGQRIKP